ncbi:MAG: putative sulfate exporter family transporter [Campylobacterales bacterium]|nr:putative sulfate exporter family transporter [Campylobacterales bacterium]
MRNGLILSGLVGLVSIILANYIPIGSVAVAIILGIIVGNAVKIPKSYNEGISYSEKTILAFAIGLMGINLDFTILSALGFKTIILIILGMIVTIFSALFIGRLLGLDKKLSLLLGIGNGVCGSSAIGAIAPILKADKDSIGISVAIVNLLGTIGIFLVPFIALGIGLNEIDSGILVGNTLQAVGQVTAGGFAISDTAGVSATAVKMGRVLLLTPLILILIYLYTEKDNKEVKTGKFPTFILFFILFSIISSFKILNPDLEKLISLISHLALVIAMSSVGLKIHFSSIKSSGSLALKAGVFIFLIQILFTGFFLYTS